MIAWLLTRCGSTVQLAGLQRELGVELGLRATCALEGVASPHQLPPGSGPALFTAFAAVALYVLTHAL